MERKIVSNLKYVGEKYGRKKCPKCGRLNFIIKQIKSKYKEECKNCGFMIQMPSVIIYTDEKPPSVIDRKEKSRGKTKNG